MTIPKRYLQKDSWPHQFAPTGKTKEGDWGTSITESRCTYCGLEWWVGKDSRPIGKCPARVDKSEYKRLGVDNG